MLRFIFSLLSLAVLGAFGVLVYLAQSDELKPKKSVYYPKPKESKWAFQSIDTMKYSRDLARERAGDSAFDQDIDRQARLIAETGATHMVVATPYDPEFLPMLRRWVAAARTHHMNVWFRGNFAGWEEWFEYPRITREEHLKKTESFILDNPDLFRDGDAFSSCPECENGGPGDPRLNGDVIGHRKFLIAEYEMMERSFEELGVRVRTNFFSMNGDVAKLIMDKATTQALGGIVTVDHYVESPEKLAADLEELSRLSGGRIVLGEFGVPIPDIHGVMTEDEQAVWLDRLFTLLRESQVIEGMSYWLAIGGTTEIWESHGLPKEAVGVIRKNYHPHIAYGFVENELGQPIEGASVTYGKRETDLTNQDGYFTKAFVTDLPVTFAVSAPGYRPGEMTVASLEGEQRIVLIKEERDWKYETLLWLKAMLGK